MRKRSITRVVGAAIAGGALVLGGSAAAYADTPTAPLLGSGPVDGGTSVAVPEPEGGHFTQVSSTSYFGLAIGSDGNAYAWGANHYGQLGDGTTDDRSIPAPVAMPDGVTATSVSAGSTLSLAVDTGGNAYAWGSNFYGQLGDGTTTNRSAPVPVAMPDGVTFTSVSAGQDHSVAIGSDGNAYAWGNNNSGQLGDGTTTNRSAPVPVAMPDGVTFTSVSAGFLQSLAVGSDGKAYSWGFNGSGQLGDGTTTSRSAPALVAMPDGVRVTSVSAGFLRSLAVDSGGNAYSWGSNASGQLGDGTATDRLSPVPVAMPDGVTFTSVAADSTHSLAVGSDGNTYAWGDNYYGQLGDGTTTNRSAPVPVAMPDGVTFTSVSSGGNLSVAIGSDGNTYAWGFNGSGQVGDGTTTDRWTPVLIAVPVEVTKITFDGVDGTGLIDNEDGTWSVVTPAHSAGPVDVVVEWTLGGIVQVPVVYADGFTYLPPAVAPTITDPADQTVKDSDTAVFEVRTTGTPEAAVTWEVSTDGGTTWRVITSAEGSISEDGLVLTVIGTGGNDGHQYRATATNEAGTATSAPAVLTVTTGGGGDGGEEENAANNTQEKGTELPLTGADNSSTVVLLGSALLLVVGGGLVAHRLLQRRNAS